MVQCPETGRAISTNIETDRASFNATPVFFGRTFCPICQIHHEWFAKDAWISERRNSLRSSGARFAAIGGKSKSKSA